MPKIPPDDAPANWRAAGIYQIRNVRDGKRYGGSASVLKRRRAKHRRDLGRGIHGNRHLQAAWNKYGKEAFVFEILEIVNLDGLTNQQANELLIERENYWLVKLGAGDRERCYNLAPAAGTTLGIKLSDEARANISAGHKGLTAWNKGIPVTEEHRKKLSEAGKRQVQTEETRAKRIKTMTGRIRSEAEREAITIAQRKRREREQAEGYVMSDEERAKHASRKGKQWSDEVKAKMSETHKKNAEEKRQALAEQAAALAEFEAAHPVQRKRVTFG